MWGHAQAERKHTCNASPSSQMDAVKIVPGEGSKPPKVVMARAAAKGDVVMVSAQRCNLVSVFCSVCLAFLCCDNYCI